MRKRSPLTPRKSNAQGVPPLGFAGFTLLEVMLVIGVLAVVAGISWPMLERLYGNHELKQSAENVRKELTATRLRAIDAGVVYQFRYEIGKQLYFAAPLERVETGDAVNGESEFVRVAGELPEGLRFEAADESLGGERVAEALLSGLENAHNLSQASWAPAILFFGDGAGTEAAFRVLDEDDRYIEISVRELTGGVKIAPIGRKERR